jgi:hypothetical protein
MAEEECYARLHGEREGMVKIVHLPPRRPRYAALLRGEQLRRLFEEKLDSRDQAEAASSASPRST